MRTCCRCLWQALATGLKWLKSVLTTELDSAVRAGRFLGLDFFPAAWASRHLVERQA